VVSTDAPTTPTELDAPPAWASSTLRERTAWCRRFRSRIVERADDLVALISEEVHKPAFEAWASDVLPLLMALRWHEKRAPRVLRERRLGGTPLVLAGSTHRVMRAPLGRVGIIATWNYPVQLLGIQVVQAICGGNTLVVKPSEHAPRTQRLLLELAAADLPTGTVAMTDTTRDAGRRMLIEHRFDHVVFTGSTGVGRVVAETLAPRLTASTLELSGRDSAFVLDDADVTLAAKTLAFAVRANGGQTCMAPRRVLVCETIYRRFVEALEAATGSDQPRRLISADAAARARRLVDEARQAGARVLHDAEREAGDEADAMGADGATIRPAFVVDCPEDATLVAGDHFAPALAVVRCRDVEHALAIHDRVDQHLTAMVFAGDARRARELAPRLRASNVMINDAIVPFVHPAASLSGHSASGWGSSQGVSGLLAMTRAVHVSRTPHTLRTPTEEPTAKRASQFRGLVRWWYRGGALQPGEGRLVSVETGGPIDERGAATGASESGSAANASGGVSLGTSPCDVASSADSAGDPAGAVKEQAS
jgi:acyl-CoA reductase-like NAD-dependent aldehyde dehydrogenase